MIKSCPFCGAEPVVTFRKLFKTYAVRCDTKGCEIEAFFCKPRKDECYDCFTEEEAVKRWNIRFAATESEIKRRIW